MGVFQGGARKTVRQNILTRYDWIW